LFAVLRPEKGFEAVSDISTHGDINSARPNGRILIQPLFVQPERIKRSIHCAFHNRQLAKDNRPLSADSAETKGSKLNYAFKKTYPDQK
jgi:hypothetical protein